MAPELISNFVGELADSHVQLLESLDVLKEPDCAFVIIATSTLPLLGLFFLVMGSAHVFTLKEQASNDLEEDYLLAILWKHLQKLIVAFEFEDQASHLMKGVDRCQDDFALHQLI